MKVWITKYALTKGLYEVDAEIVDNTYARTKTKWPVFTREWAKTKADAVAKAEGMRKRRVASLHKSLKKLEAMKFA